MKRTFLFLLLLLSAILVSCDSESGNHAQPNEPVREGFEYVSTEHSGIDFNNKLELHRTKTAADYINVFNGGGVSCGDINNDGLVDIYFTGNLVSNKLYLNKGNMQFEDITESAGVAAKNTWCTGTTMADVNNDGFLDIYVSRSYIDEVEDLRANLLFINNGDNTFTEKAKDYGIDDKSYSIQSLFFDMDNDGDLDLYVGNHPREMLILPGKKNHYEKWQEKNHAFSDHVYRNNGDGTFTDVTESSGMLSYGWTLNPVASDFNNDGFTDIYVCTDHNEPDLYWENNGDGTFTNKIAETFKHISFSSMGSDAVDLNNDGLMDLVTLDMLSEDNYREKSQMASMNIERYWTMVDQGYHHQIMRNMMHINTGLGTFQEVGQLGGIHKTDWSWAVLGADYNHDGKNDLYVTNGYLLNIMDTDLRGQMQKMYYDAYQQNNYLPILDKINKEFHNKYSSTPIKNVFFLNKGDLDFDNASAKYSLDYEGFSSGASYADLDNDGDLDIVVNNINSPATLHRNENGNSNSQQYLRIKLDNGDKTAIGTKVTAYLDDEKMSQELYTTRGYQSSVEPVLHFGLGEKKPSKIEIRWPGNVLQTIESPEVNTTLTIKNESGIKAAIANPNLPFKEVSKSVNLDVKHIENSFDDFEKQILVPHKMSQFGPSLTKGDVNNDGLEDFYLGGANGTQGKIYIQNKSGHFIEGQNTAFTKHSSSEDIDALFLDVDGDKDLDLYVVSGGNEYRKGSAEYRDRLYINDGKGVFNYDTQALNGIPAISGGCVAANDYDKDGDLDLFVGNRHTPWEYPTPGNSQLLKNDNGTFTNVTDSEFSALNGLGMVTDAIWTDLDKDNNPELVIVGEWMSIRVFESSGESFTDISESLGLKETNGWWFSVESTDLDGDGFEDLCVGNLGNNYKYKAGDGHQFHLYAKDFDDNGSQDIVLAYKNNDQIVPVRGRECSSQQCPDIKKKFPSYKDFASADLFEIYDDIDQASHTAINTFKSTAFINNAGTSLKAVPFPNLAQVSPTNSIVFMDTDGDGVDEIILGGNLYVSEVETGRADAGVGVVLNYVGENGFQIRPTYETGLLLDKDVKRMEVITSANGEKLLLVANNDDYLQVWRSTQS